jgi:hypothetical protein
MPVGHAGEVSETSAAVKAAGKTVIIKMNIKFVLIFSFLRD